MMKVERLVEGNPAAAVRMVLYEDLQCKDCAYLARLTDERILPTFGDRIAIEHREFPLKKHDWAWEAAIAARYFQRRGLGVPFRRETLRSVESISADRFTDWVRQFAERHGLDPAEADAALGDPTLAKAVDEDLAEGNAQKVEKTPTVFVGRRVFIERVPWDELSAAIDEALRQ